MAKSQQAAAAFKKLNALPGDSAIRVILITFCLLVAAIGRKWVSSTSPTARALLLISITVACFTTYWWIATIVYRIWFHPLAIYPGPPIAAFTDWYSVYHCAIGDRHLDFKRLHDKYGSIVRYGPHRIACNTKTSLQDIYHVRANCQKSQYFSVFSHFFEVPMSMTTIDRKAHAFKRRVDAEALTSKAIHKLENAVLKNVNKFCQLMVDSEQFARNEWSSSRNMSKWCGYLMTDTMGDITFHRNWNMMSSTENRELLETLSKGVGGLDMMGHMQGILEWKIDKVLFRGATKGTYQYKELSEDQSRWRMEHASEIKDSDLFGSLLEARDPETGKGFSQEELIAEAGLLIIAGSQTSATAITSTLFYLLKFPVAMKKFTAEILNTFDSLEEIRGGAKLKGCVYARACLDESMRLSPGVGGILPREVLEGGMTVDGHLIPAGADVGVANYAIHHNEEYFPQPYHFRPERWLLRSEDPEGVGEEELAISQSAYAPFSVGRASCVGKDLAYQEIGIVLARLVWLYDMRIEPGAALGGGSPSLGKYRESEKEFQTYDNFVAAHDGPMMQFKPRT